MQGFNWNFSIVILAAVLCQLTLAMPSIRTKRQNELQFNDEPSDLNPIDAEESYDDLDREKRKLPDAKFAGKNAVIGFVFGASKGSGQASAQASGLSGRPTRQFPIPQATRAPITTTTDDTPDFDRTNVSLDLPSQLFSNSFKTVTDISKIFGGFVMNSSRRYANFVNFFKPLIGNSLTIEGLNPPPPTTTTTRRPFV